MIGSGSLGPMFDRFESGVVTAAFLARDSGALVDCERGATRLDWPYEGEFQKLVQLIDSAFIAWIATTLSPVQFATGRQVQTLVKVSLPSRTLCTCRSIHKVLLCLLYSVHNATKGTFRPSVHTAASNVLWNRLGIYTISVLLSIIQIFTTLIFVCLPSFLSTQTRDSLHCSKNLAQVQRP